MKVSKDAARSARRIFSLCSKSGQLDENLLRGTIAKIVESKPRDFRGILHALQRLVRLDVESRQALVESAAELDAASRSTVEADLAKQYGQGLSFSYQVTPELLGGVRIRVGNDVLDGSVKSRLERLEKAF